MMSGYFAQFFVAAVASGHRRVPVSDVKAGEQNLTLSYGLANTRKLDGCLGERNGRGGSKIPLRATRESASNWVHRDYIRNNPLMGSVPSNRGGVGLLFWLF